MSSFSLPRPDLFIAAMGRSGSTMLANLFTTPPERWVLVEPRLADASTGRDVLDQARSFGWDLTDGHWCLAPGEDALQRIHRVFAARLRGLKKWGVKEVRSELFGPTINILRPRQTLVLVRDLRDVAISLHAKIIRDDNPNYDEDWLRGYLTKTPKAIVDLARDVEQLDHMTVRYEDLVRDLGVRVKIAQWAEWPLDGAPDRNLATVFGRGREVALHAGAVTEKALARHQRPDISDGARAIAAWAHDVGRQYQQRFGYA